MIIDGIECGIVLFIDDEDGNERGDFFFHDFKEFNAFVREAGNQYDDCDCTYSIVEVIDDKPEPFSWTDTIELLEIDDDEAADIIYDYRQYMKEVERFSQIDNEKTRTRVDEFKGGDPNRKLLWKNEYTYVCPYCMYDLEKCKCNKYPFYLIQIDTKILPVIRLLNEKGYVTTSCCAGHLLDLFERCTNIYIAFKERYDFPVPYPSGGIYNSDAVLRYEKGSRKTAEELEIFQDQTLKALMSWAERL